MFLNAEKNFFVFDVVKMEKSEKFGGISTKLGKTVCLLLFSFKCGAG